MEIKTTEFFKNIKHLPPKDSDEYNQLVDWEISKITGGITVNGVYISGWLYWHLNHWWIRVDELDEDDNIIRVPRLPELRDNEWIRAEYLEQCKRDKKGYMEVGGRQSGKALRHGSTLYTQNGTTTIEKVKIGDFIYGDDGELTKVVGVYPQGLKDIYRITLLDGRFVDCTEDHLWTLYTKKITKKKSDGVKKVTISTKDLLSKYFKWRKDSHNKSEYVQKREYLYSIPSISAINYPKKELKLPPYFLGLWLGDGTERHASITTIDKEIVDYITLFASERKLLVIPDDVCYRITSGIMGGNNKELQNKNSVLNDLRYYNLIENKHIPYDYLYGSIEQRLELLRGLMDTDGSVYKDGTISFSSSNETLAKDFEILCRSLGINLKVTKRKSGYKKNGAYIPCKTSYSFSIFTDLLIFKLSRKIERLRYFNKELSRTQKSKIEKTRIVDISLIGKDLATCIRVDNESHLFLTNDFIPTHNSEMEASYFGMNATIFENTQNLIVCGNDDDLSLLKDKVDFGLKRLWKGIAIPRLDKTWRLNQIRLGYKDVSGEDQIWSYIIIRNARDGHNTEAGAGTTAKTVIFDEVGKYLFASAFKAVEPAIKSKFGWRAVPIMVGTGGSFQNGKDAENFFYNPDANNFLSVVDEKTNKKTAIFLSGLYRLDCKEELKLGDWLRSRGMEIEDVSELNHLTIAVSNKEKANDLIVQEREQAKTNPDRTLFLKQKMYYPLTTDECFLTEQQNIFDIDACKRQQARLFAEGRVGTPVIMMNDGEKIVHSFTDKQPISNFPVKPEDDKDAPIIIYEFPVENAPYGLYTAGVDSYRSGQAKYSTSLGTVYIYKRMTSITGEKYQNVLVASYAARPDKKEKWEEQARLLIKYYNARTLVENDEISFIDYMVAKGDARYLESQPEWLKEIVPNTTVKRDFGIHRSAEKVRNFLHSCLKKYTEEIVYQEKDESGNIVKEVLGITRIFDPMLLEEMIHYNDDDNFDRVIAAELAIALAMKLDPLFGAVGHDDRKYIPVKKRKAILFPETQNRMLKKRKQRLFL